jgi:uncharacterized membrane protein
MDTMDGTQRLDAFTDGVFAISITVLVLELQVPHLNASNSFGDALLQQWPQYFSYFISFLNIGIVWANHHEMFRFIKRADHIFLVINVFFLMTLTLIPFSTSLLAEYLKEHNHQLAVTAFYTGNWLLNALFINAIWLYALKNNLMDDRCNLEAVRFQTRGFHVGLLLISIGFVCSFFWYPAGLALVTLVNVLFMLPGTKRPFYRAGSSDVSN